MISLTGTAQIGYQEAISTVAFNATVIWEPVMHIGVILARSTFSVGCAAGCACFAFGARILQLRSGLLLGAVFMTLTSLLFSLFKFVSNLAVFWLLRFFAGVPVGFFVGFQTIFISDIALFAYRQNLLALSGIAVPVGFLIAMALTRTGIFKWEECWYYSIMLPAIPSALFFAYGIRLKEPPLILMMCGLEDDAKRSAQYYHGEEDVEQALSEALERLRAQVFAIRTVL
ncbi:unnamed protein product [Toxocara canis]|nr:unnamed protein product [Toxocara canis]